MVKTIKVPFLCSPVLSEEGSMGGLSPEVISLVTMTVLGVGALVAVCMALLTVLIPDRDEDREAQGICLPGDKPKE